MMQHQALRQPLVCKGKHIRPAPSIIKEHTFFGASLMAQMTPDDYINQLDEICRNYIEYLEKKIVRMAGGNALVPATAMPIKKKISIFKKLCAILHENIPHLGINNNSQVNASEDDLKDQASTRIIIAFKIKFDKIKPTLTSKKDYAVIKAIGHIFLSIITIGFYPAIRAGYSYQHHQSGKFWQARKEMVKDALQDNIDEALPKNPNTK